MLNTPAQASAAELPATDSELGPWVRVTISAALLGCIGGVLGSLLLFGVFYARFVRSRLPLSLELFFAPRDIAESLAVALCVLLGYRRSPAMHQAMRSDVGVLTVSAIVGSLTMLTMRLVVYHEGVKLQILTLLVWLLYVGCIALPIVWTIARRAPDAIPRAGPTRLSDREFFRTSVGLFLTVSCLAFMHWLIHSDTVFNFFAILVLPVTAIVLGLSTRRLLDGVAKRLEWRASGSFLAVISVLFAMVVTIYYMFPSHSTKHW